MSEIRADGAQLRAAMSDVKEQLATATSDIEANIAQAGSLESFLITVTHDMASSQSRLISLGTMSAQHSAALVASQASLDRLIADRVLLAAGAVINESVGKEHKGYSPRIKFFLGSREHKAFLRMIPALHNTAVEELLLELSGIISRRDVTTHPVRSEDIPAEVETSRQLITTGVRNLVPFACMILDHFPLGRQCFFSCGYVSQSWGGVAAGITIVSVCLGLCVAGLLCPCVSYVHVSLWPRVSRSVSLRV